MSKKIIIELVDNECAIVFKEDGLTMYIPKQENEEEPVSDITAICCALNIRLNDPEFVEEQINWLNKTISEFKDTQNDKN